ncbi:MAG: HEAT repeat domain-containing protein [Candidatus Sulfotelmatobacter sp.]
MITKLSFSILLIPIISGLITFPCALSQRQSDGRMEAPAGLESLMNRAAEGDSGAIPDLEKMYDLLPEDDNYRGNIASLLVTRKVTNPRYWNHLVQDATSAIDSDMPDPTALDGTGKQVPRKLSEKFREWCKRRHLDANRAAERAIYGLPGQIWPLAASGDPRGFPLLMKGLQSQNSYVASISALGLAHIGDPRAILPIQQRCEKAPEFAAKTIGLGLLYFEGAKAEQAARRCISDEEFITTIREDAKKRGRAAFFPW